jgi:predicted DNA-binding transcriptional regulator AlpA
MPKQPKEKDKNMSVEEALVEDSFLMDVKDLARELRVSETTIWTWTRKKFLPQPVHIGRLVRWYRSEIAEWIAGNAKRRA